MTPLTSIATIDDLIVALLRLGYKKEYDEWHPSKEGKIIEDYEPENERNTFLVWRVAKQNLVNVIINYKTDPIDDVYEVGDVCLVASIVGEYYPYIKYWSIYESCGGSQYRVKWEVIEEINLEEIDKFLNESIAVWNEDWEKNNAGR